MKKKLISQIITSVVMLFFVACDSGNKNERKQKTKILEQEIEVDLPIEQYEVSYTSVKIGDQEWMSSNLNVQTFINGDTILEAKSDKEWRIAIGNKQPAWCYSKNVTNDSLKGRIYNYYAVSDERSIVPKGWRIANNKDWDILIYSNKEDSKQVNNVKNLSRRWHHITKEVDENGFNDYNGGYRYKSGRFYANNKNSFYWCSNTSYTLKNGSLSKRPKRKFGISTSAIGSDLSFIYGSIIRVPDYFGFGFYIRCIK